MNPFILLPITLAIIALAPAAAAQPRPGQGAEITIADNLRVSAPPRWRLSNQTRDSVQYYVPLAANRPRTEDRPQTQTPRSGDAEVKPLYLALYEAGLVVTTERRRDHAEAVRRLAEIASEQPTSVTRLLIGGWPAIERRYRALMPQLGGVFGTSGNVETWWATTAIAAGTTVIRFETMLAPDADEKLLDEALAIGRAMRAPPGPASASRRELDDIQRMTKPPAPAGAQRPAPGGGERPSLDGDKQAGIAVLARTGRGELEVATNDGQHVLIAANSGRALSDNFGASFTATGGPPCTPGFVCNGDPSLAVGASGAMYYAWIEGASLTTLGDAVARSIDNGGTFTLQGRAAVCPGSTSCSVADQEHIAADRVNPASGGGDLLYNVWRDFGTPFSIRISCSTDSGVTWTGGVAIAAAGDFPRVSVGRDGFVYVAWASGGNMMLHKYSNCDSGLVAQVGFPVTVSAFTNVVCPVPGLDRCNGRNILSSPKVAVDDLDANHLYYVFATATVAGNEDIMVFDSVDGGATFPRSVRVNSAVTGRRYMPWISSYGGVAVVTWYDRRSASAGNNDLTRFYRGGAAVRGPNLQALAEADISGTDDAQCSTWPCATNATTDSESCSIQPQLGGRCALSGGTPTSGSQTPCDFSSTACPAGEICSINRGCPKYGDYNGNAAGAGLLYSAWASATPPASVGGASGAIRVYASADRIPSDFYVRDWNTSATVFDNGAQPSTNPVFWATSDVWNQASNLAPSFGPSGWIAGDPPSRSGSNFLFSRVSRRAAAAATAPAAPVTVNFFYGDFGLGSAYIPIGSESVSFTAGDMTQLTPAHSWTVPASASLHLCIAVQIDGPDGDVSALPSVAGTAPGPADPLILIDNNKAQRNLQDTIGTAGGTEVIAVIRNPDLTARTMRLRMRLPRGVQVPGTLEIVGGRKVPIADNGLIDIGRLAPGERRWVRMRVASFARLDRPVPLDILDDTQPPANGFTLLLRRTSFENVARRALIDFAGVITRLNHLQDNAAAKGLADFALRTSKGLNETSYADYLAANRKAIGQMVTAHLSWAKGADPFELKAAAAALMRAADAKNVEAAAAAQAALAERLDGHLSMLMRAKGSLDDIVHNVAWQRALFVKRGAGSSAELVQQATRFLADKNGPSEFVKFIDAGAGALDRAIDSFGANGSAAKKTLVALQAGMKGEASPATLQKLHRDVLLEVHKLAGQ